MTGVSVADLIPEPMPGEVAAAEAMSDELPVPIRQIVDPLQTPVAFLKVLAAHEGVRLWYDDWPEARRRQIIHRWTQLAALFGTREGAALLLPYVDAELIDTLAYPARFVMGRARIGRTPVGHPPFLARYLVRTTTHTPPHAFVMGRSVIGRARLKTPSRESLKRALTALRVAKAPETEVRVDFAHHRRRTLHDGLSLDPGYRLGSYMPRNKI
jgi:P2-related tail formation protein